MLACTATSGCLWPTSLTDAVTDNTAVRPVFSSASPPFGTISRSINQLTEIQLRAEDPNPNGDVLHVRLFLLGDAGGDTRKWTGNEITLAHLTGGDPKDANTFGGTLFSGGFDLCGFYGDGTDLFVVVSDAPFFNEAGTQNRSNGLTDENHWTLRCQ